jgi:hypothetical protein
LEPSAFGLIFALAHKFTRASDFNGLAALSRNFLFVRPPLRGLRSETPRCVSGADET